MKMNTKSLIIVADIESFIKKNAQERASHHEAFLLGLYDEHDFSIVNLKEEKKDMISIMINFVEKHRDKEKQVYIYFHNLSSFDGLFILKELTQFNYNYQKIIRDGKIYELALKMKDYRILIRDSFLLYPKSLKKAAEDFNDKYFKDDYPLKELHLDYVQKHEKELKAYLKKDLQCLYEFLMHYNNYLLKTFNYSITSNLTLTSLSHKLYLQHYYQGTMPKITKRQDIFLRQSYKGGIVDIYKPQGKNLVHLDVNAMYPFIMKNHSFGDSSFIFLSKLENIAPNLYEFTKSHRSFIRVIVICKELYRPLITIK